MLVKNAAGGDVHHVHPPTDRQGGQPETPSGGHERELKVVPVRVHTVGRGVGIGAVAVWVDVAPASEEQPGERGQQGLSILASGTRDEP